MTKTEATAAAREVVATYVRTNRQWSTASIASCLPRGYDLRDGASYAGPATIADIAAFIRREAIAA